MYEKYEIEKMLRTYLKSKSQANELRAKIEKNETLLKYENKEYRESDKEVIEGMSLSGPVISDIPKRKNK